MKEIRLRKYITDDIAYYNIIAIYKDLKSRGDIQLITYFKFLVWASLNHPNDSNGCWLSPTEFGRGLNIKKIYDYYQYAKNGSGIRAFGFDGTNLKSLI